MWRCDDCGGSDEAPELAETPFVIGDRIEARWAGRATWYPGVIEAIDGDRYGILYDDSETESGVAEALIRLEPTSAAPMPALRHPEAHDDASARPVAVPVATGPVLFCVACWTGRRVLRHTCLVGTSAQELLLPIHKIPGWLVTTCNVLAERASGDTVHGVACKIVEHYAHPLLYRNPKGALWWREKLDACRTSYESLMDIIEEVASANAYAFHRRLKDRVHGIGKGARLLRQTTQDECRTRAVQLAHALLRKAQTDIIGKAKNRWKDVEVRVDRLKVSLAAKKGVKGRSTFDYDSPGATNMIRRGEFKGLHMGGCSFGSGKDMMRAVVAHANGVDISEVDGYYAVVSVDTGEVQEGETGTTMACRMEDIAAPGALRDDFIGTLQQRCDSVAQTKIGDGVLVAAASATCTEFFNLRAALENRLPTQIKLLARILRDEKFSGYDGIGARWGSMSPQARDAFICVEIKFQAPRASARWRGGRRR